MSEKGGEGIVFVLSLLKAVNLWPQFLDSDINEKQNNAKKSPPKKSITKRNIIFCLLKGFLNCNNANDISTCH